MTIHSMKQKLVAHCCPYCHSTAYIKNGKYKQAQRYKCKNCHKQFKDTSLTALHWLHKTGKVQRYFQAMQNSLSVRKAAKYAGVSKGTAFAWRHKFLTSLSSGQFYVSNSNAATVKSVKIFTLPYSAKGRKKEPEKNREKSITVIQLEGGQLCIKKIARRRAVKQISSEIQTGKPEVYIARVPNKLLHASLVRTEGIKTITRTDFADKLLNQISQKQENILQWMKRFKGVASKYLQQYWSWYATLNNTASMKNEAELFNQICISNRALLIYRMLKDI